MTLEEYRSAINSIDSEANRQKNIIHRKFAEERNPFKIGDIVTDHYQTIRIEEMGVYLSYGTPQMKFFGPVLTKSGYERKDKAKSWVFQENVKNA